MARILCICLLFAFQIFQSSLFFSLAGGNDNIYQLLSAKTFLEQGKMSIPTAIYEGGEIKEVRTPANLFPPAYGLTIAALVKVGFSYFDAARLLHGFAIFCFLLVLFLWQKSLFPEFWKQKEAIMSFLFLGIAAAPLRFWGTTDILALSFWAAGMLVFYQKILLSDKEKTNNLWYWLLTFTGILLASLFRFAYLTMFALPFFVLITRYFVISAPLNHPNTKNLFPQHKKSIFSSFVFACIFYFGYKIIFETCIGGVAKSADTETGFYPQNLLSFANFPYRAFFYIDKEGIVSRISTLSITENTLISLIFGLLSTGIAILFAKIFQKQNIQLKLLTSISIFFTMGMLGTLSLYFAPQLGSWTYVQESRYFAPVQFFLLLFVLFGREKQEKIVSMLLLLALFYGGIHSTWRIAQYVGGNHEGTLESAEDQKIQQLYVHLQEKTKREKVLFLYHQDESIARIAALAGALPLKKSIFDSIPPEKWKQYSIETESELAK